MDLSFVTSFFVTRVFGHLPSTASGAIAAVALSLSQYVGALHVDPKWSFVVYLSAALLAAIGAAYKPAAPVKGFVTLGQAAVLALFATAALFGCSTLSAVNGSTGPIPLAETTQSDGTKVPTATVTISASPVTGVAPACAKPVTASFDTTSGYHDLCSAMVPVAPVGGACK